MIFRDIFIILAILLTIIKVNHGQGIDREPEYRCTSIDVRNSPDELNKLENCTVITGYLTIVLIQKATKNDFEKYSFPKLREITDYLLVYDVKGLTRFDTLFPNLTVIRGRRLFLNYALSIYTMPDLEVVGLKSLLAIQRGHIFIDRCPKLCYLNTVNWDHLTQSPGANLIKSDINADCSNKCLGCKYCWSNFNCQHFNNTNLIYPGKQCHPLCLGGCYNNTPEGCLLCTGYSNDGNCVEKCPSNRIISKDHLRCFTKEECHYMFMYIYNDECVTFCPSGYYEFRRKGKLRQCLPCQEDCPRICEGNIIHNLGASEEYRGCIIVNSSLTIRIPGTVNENELENNFSGIREIWGYLKIADTPSIKSMALFRNLEKINTENVDNSTFGLIIYGNKNLEHLWNRNDKKIIYMNQSSIFMHSNYKLCNSEIKKFVESIEHLHEYDEIQYNDQEVLCDPHTLNVTVEVIAHDSVILKWEMANTATEIKISYAEAPSNITLINFDYDIDHCERELWSIKYLLREKDFQSNATTVNYNLTSLKQNTRYGCVIKTFGGRAEDSKQSPILYFTTKPDIPTAPIVYTQNKTTDSIELAWFSAPFEYDQNEIITHYQVDIFKYPDKQEILDQRNYCKEPFQNIDITAELLDYDNCCNTVEFEREEFEFISLVDDKFQCSLDIPKSCDVVEYSMRHRRSTNINNGYNGGLVIPEAYMSESYVTTINIPANQTSIIIPELKHFTLYVFQFFACNEQGCGPYFLHSDRTAPDKEADKIEDFQISVLENQSEYDYHVKIIPPKDPNGALLVFTIYFRAGETGKYRGFVECVTRKDLEKTNYIYTKTFPYNDYKISIRAISLAGPGKITEWKLFKQEGGEDQQQKDHSSPTSDPNIANTIDDDNKKSDLHQNASWDWFIVFFVIIFAGIVFFIYLGIKRRMNQRREEGGIGREILHPRQNVQSDDEQILLQDVQRVNVDENNDPDSSYGQEEHRF